MRLPPTALVLAVSLFAGNARAQSLNERLCSASIYCFTDDDGPWSGFHVVPQARLGLFQIPFGQGTRNDLGPALAAFQPTAGATIRWWTFHGVFAARWQAVYGDGPGVDLNDGAGRRGTHLFATTIGVEGASLVAMDIGLANSRWDDNLESLDVGGVFSFSLEISSAVIELTALIGQLKD
ncbi:MAG: hypothetical protein AAF715_23500 [Myxococcota bacterium]